PTDLGFGTLNETFEHPLLELTDEYIGERRLVANDVFRIVHDAFGHAKEGNGFGPIGEENAWHSHVRMYSPLAARAMTTETRGQNSWVNYGPFGEQNRANQRETIYADQKATLLPEWVSTLGIEEGHEQVVDIGEATPASDEQFAAVDDLPPQFVMVSAERAGLSPEENARRTEQLEQDLREAGFEPQRARGMYQGVPEASFLVPIADATELAEVLQLGLEKYEQESVLVVDEERRARLEFLDDFPMELGRFNPVESVEGLEAFTEIPEGGGRFFAALPVEQEAETFEQAPITESDAFKEWFGDSKVVDENGEPLVVYHGTRSDITAFEPGRDGAIYFTDSPEDASAFAGDFRGLTAELQSFELGGANVIPAFLSIRNPLEHDFGGELFDPDDVERVIRRARREGHDGVIIRNIRNFEGGGTSTTYIVFRPEQVKSAIGNRGTFDPSSPNILEQGPISDLQVVEREELGGGFLLEADGGNTALMRVYNRDGFFQIAGVEVAESVRGRGAGQQLIRRAYAEAKRRGGPLVSDTEVTVAQLRAYEGLKRRGWIIEYADPDAVAKALRTNDPELEVKS